MSPEFDLRRDLIALRRGRALETPELIGRLGPRLRALSGVTGSDQDREIRPKLRALLTGLLRDLPADLRRAAELAFALDRAHLLPRLNDRIEQLCAELNCQPRTARRRMDLAIEQMVRTADTTPVDAQPDRPRPGWETRSLEALLRLDTPGAELYETRTISAARTLGRITFLFGLPRTNGDELRLGVDALYGVRVEEVELQPDGDNYAVTVALPTTLEPGQEHRFCLHYSVPPGQPMSPHYAIVPLKPCIRGTVRVRFDPGRLPAEVWRLDEVPYMQLRHRRPGPHFLVPDPVGELLVDFTGLREGHGYGLAWSF